MCVYLYVSPFFFSVDREEVIGHADEEKRHIGLRVWFLY